MKIPFALKNNNVLLINIEKHIIKPMNRNIVNEIAKRIREILIKAFIFFKYYLLIFQIIDINIKLFFYKRNKFFNFFSLTIFYFYKYMELKKIIIKNI